MVRNIEDIINEDIAYCSFVTDQSIEKYLPEEFIKKIEYKTYSLDEIDMAKENSNTIICLTTCDNLLNILKEKGNYILVPTDLNLFSLIDTININKLYLVEKTYEKNSILQLKLYVYLESMTLYESLKDLVEYVFCNKLKYIDVLKNCTHNKAFTIAMLIRMLYIASKHYNNLFVLSTHNLQDDKFLVNKLQIDYISELKNKYNLSLSAFYFDNNACKYEEINKYLPIFLKEYKSNLDSLQKSQAVLLNNIYKYLQSAYIFADSNSDYFQFSINNMF